MTDHGFALFETAVGLCGVAWSSSGILGVQLPEGDATRTRALTPALPAGAGDRGA